jgi:hypothetical protein
MKKINLPKIFFKLLLIVVVITMFLEVIFPYGGRTIILYYFIIVTPVSTILLIIWKLYNRNIKNQFFIPILIVNILSIILIIYIFMHLFDGLIM